MAAASQPPSGDPVERFAFELRALRNSAGGPTYRQMAARTGQSSSALSNAAKGRQLPPLEVALAYAEACAGDRTEWERRWRAAKAELSTAPRRRWPVVAAAGTVGLALVVAVAVLVSRLAHEPPPSDAADHSPRFFSNDDAFNQRHPRPYLSPDSAQMVADLLALGRVELYTGKAGSLVYRATSSTPTYEVTPASTSSNGGPTPSKASAFPGTHRGRNRHQSANGRW